VPKGRGTRLPRIGSPEQIGAPRGTPCIHVEAVDERDLIAVRGNNFEKLKGNRSHQYSMRLNDQWRLILEIKTASPKNIVVVIDIVDYH
jgi:plasmid maintenance system killer protein